MDLTFDQVANRGERILECERPQMVREHKDRYTFAASFVRTGDTVLDCACGSGYGTAMLARCAIQTIGMDISEVAIAYSRENYRQRGLRFEVGNAQALELPSDSIDVYCSYETLE